MTTNGRDLRDELRRADWKALLPRLGLYASRKLRLAGWPDGRDEEPGALAVQDVVNMAIEKCLDGSRVMPVNDALSLQSFLFGVIRSIVSNERKAYVRAKTETAHTIDDMAVSEVVAADELLEQEQARVALLCEVDGCISDNDELGMFNLAVQEGALTPKEVAALLDWSVERAQAARIKMQRRLLRRLPQRFSAYKKKRVTS